MYRLSTIFTLLLAAAIHSHVAATVVPDTTELKVPASLLPVPGATMTVRVDDNATQEQGKTLTEAAPPAFGRRTATATSTATTRTQRDKTASLSSTADLEGNYVMTYEAHASYTNIWGCGITVTAIEGTDSIAMEGFWKEGHTVKAYVDLDNMTLTIPCQVIGTTSDYGDYDIALSDSSGTPYRTGEITGTINDDGTMSISSWWGVFVASGAYKNNYYALNSESELEQANASMTYQTYDSGTINDHTFAVVVSQDGNKVNVKNFANIGINIEIKLKNDSTATIVKQYAYTVGSYDSDAYLYAFYYYSDYSGVYAYYNKIDCAKATDLRTISWDGWNFVYTYDDTDYWTGVYYISGQIDTDFDLVYPDEYVPICDGDGTADDPYLIGTTAEWNDMAEYIAETEDDLTDKYIKLTADLDFSDTAITPLGYDLLTAFNGDLDGNGMTIKGFDYETTDEYSAPVVCTAMTSACIHDLTVEGTAYVRHSYCGAVVGYAYGSTITNVTSNVDMTFNNLDTSTAPYSMGGVVGCCKLSTITDCTFGGTINQTPQYSGGISGYTEQCTLTGCVNRGTVTSTTSCFGGICGYAYYYSKVTDCHNYGSFSGLGPYSGGVVGLGYGATVKNCSNNGPITAKTHYCGGVAGWIMADTTLVDCSNNAPLNFSGNYCGGVTGYVYYYGKMVNCVNTDTVNNTGSYGGGVAGCVYYYGEVIDCTNSGVVNMSNANGGGVAGYVYYYSSITDCANEGTVNLSSSYSGGVVGNASYSTITSCANRGVVNMNGDYSGGVVGTATQCTITECTNDSTVIGTKSFSGGVIGNADTDEISFCHNKGTATFENSTSAGVVGSLYNSTLSNCFNNGTTSSTGRYCAGVAGYTVSSNVTSCYNKGTVTTTDRYTGGVVGQCGASTTLRTCVNNGKVISSGIYIGGIAANTSVEGTTFTSCRNIGTVRYTGTAAACYAAGIIGYSSTGTLTACYNTGTVESTNTTSGYIAGLIGYCGVASSSDGQYNITNCYNTADISGYYCTAGLIAYSRSTAAVGMTGCYNTGNITATAKTANAAASAGLVGYFSPGSTFTSCYNTGDITTAGTTYTGGLLGNVITTPTEDTPISVSECYNAGTVTASGNGAGGIFGYMPVCTTVDKCYNTADIETNGNEAGGIAGFAAATLTNVYNAGNISGAENVGGIAGATDTATSITTGYSAGKITATGTCGNIIGSDGCSVDNVYYLSANDAEGIEGGTALTYTELATLELDGWTAGDNYTYPVLDDSDYALAHAAAVIPADGDTYDSITADFHVGAPDGVTWKASLSVVEIDGNDAIFTSDGCVGTLVMTATSGKVTVETCLNCSVITEGIDSTNEETRNVVTERLYTISGQETTRATGDKKAVYIVTRTYDDGTVTTTKEVR